MRERVSDRVIGKGKIRLDTFSLVICDSTLRVNAIIPGRAFAKIQVRPICWCMHKNHSARQGQ
jgi:hypothetical protein